MEQGGHIAGHGGDDRAHRIGGHTAFDLEQQIIAGGPVGEQPRVGYAPQHVPGFHVVYFQLQRNFGVARLAPVQLVGDIAPHQHIRAFGASQRQGQIDAVGRRHVRQFQSGEGALA